MALQEEFEQQGNWLFKHRSFLPLIVLLIGITIYTYTEFNPQTFILKGTHYEIYYEMLALTISLIGLFIRCYTIGYSQKNTSGRKTNEGLVADSLNTTGIYSIVRHPLYLGNFFMWFGPAMLTGHFWFIVAFILFYWLYYERIMFAEEQFLRNKFGEQYLEWSNRVSAFIPNFNNFNKSHLPFNWKKVLKKERNGLFALFIIFFAFDFLGETINSSTNFNYFLIGMCILTGLLFIVLKYLEKRTTLLNEQD